MTIIGISIIISTYVISFHPVIVMLYDLVINFFVISNSINRASSKCILQRAQELTQ